MSDDPAYQYTLQLQRGEGTDDRDKHKTQVSADSIEELEEKVERARELMESEVQRTREIQSNSRLSAGLKDDQESFEEWQESEEQADV